MTLLFCLYLASHSEPLFCRDRAACELRAGWHNQITRSREAVCRRAA